MTTPELRVFLRRHPTARAVLSRLLLTRRRYEATRAPRALPALRDELRDFKSDYRLAKFENDALERNIAWIRINETKRRISRLEALL
ncbi:MAG: hypothetical protein HC933_03075 [Pleurocapsa sp. SU_196_0]|nr:hypothetical protein [Pleurocapsa sp. SU_196_0]